MRKRAVIKQGVSFAPPNYIYFGKFDESSTIVDVGCGSEAEFALHLIDKYRLKAYGMDPTRKHAPALQQLEKNHPGLFTHIPKALSWQAGAIVFHESEQNESGSLLSDHHNVLNDRTLSYEVETVSLQGLSNEVHKGTIDFLKLDLEGAEYEVLDKVTPEDLKGIRQLFVEFHHHCIEQYEIADTLARVDKINQAGMESITIDDHNYLFYWQEVGV